MNKILFIGFFLMVSMFYACQADKPNSNAAIPEPPFELKIEQTLDLKSYNLPFSIKVPANAKVEAKKGFTPEYVIATRGYYLQIMPVNLGTSNRKKIKDESLKEIEARPEFSKVILNDSFGFVYETKWEKLPNAYNFRYFYTQGETYYDFRSANSRGVKQDEALLIYKNIKQE